MYILHDICQISYISVAKRKTQSSIINMPSILIFSAEDIGSNYRILRHAKSVATLPNSKVQILGPDISSLPKELEKLPNIDHHYIYLWEFPYFLDYLFFPIKILILLFQILIFSLKSNIT